RVHEGLDDKESHRDNGDAKKDRPGSWQHAPRAQDEEEQGEQRGTARGAGENERERHADRGHEQLGHRVQLVKPRVARDVQGQSCHASPPLIFIMLVMAAGPAPAVSSRPGHRAAAGMFLRPFRHSRSTSRRPPTNKPVMRSGSARTIKYETMTVSSLSGMSTTSEFRNDAIQMGQPLATRAAYSASPQTLPVWPSQRPTLMGVEESDATRATMRPRSRTRRKLDIQPMKAREPTVRPMRKLGIRYQNEMGSTVMPKTMLLIAPEKPPISGPASMAATAVPMESSHRGSLRAAAIHLPTKLMPTATGINTIDSVVSCMVHGFVFFCSLIRCRPSHKSIFTRGRPIPVTSIVLYPSWYSLPSLRRR